MESIHCFFVIKGSQYALKNCRVHDNINSVVNAYRYTVNSELKICSFDTMTDKWLQFVVDCRRGKEHGYDIVEGPMADDQVWDYVEDYTSGNISKAAFWELVKFKYPTHQIVFCTEKALRTLHFEGSETL